MISEHRIRYLLCFLLVLFLLLPAKAQNTVLLYGTLTNPQSGALFNGYLKIMLMKSGVKNTCTTPYQVVPTISKVYKVVNGTIQNPNGDKYLAQTCMSPRVPYYIEMDDVNHQFMYYDNWYLPLNTNTLIDVGTLEKVGFGGPIVVSIPQAIVSNPNGEQDIQQPGTTALVVNNLTVTGIFNSTQGVQNAQVAGRFAANPTACSGGQVSYGINEYGNALCMSIGSATNLAFLYLYSNPGTSYTAQGFYAGWNIPNGSGATDFINERGGGGGGFNFYNLGAGTLGNPIVSFDGAGNIYATSFNGIVANANHASAADSLTSAPAGCGTGQALARITGSGNPAQCVPVAAAQGTDFFTVANVCPSGMSGTAAGSFCGGSVVFANQSLPNMANFNYNLICTYDSSNCNGGTCTASVTTYGKVATGFSYYVVLTRANGGVPTNGQIGYLECERHQY